MMTQHVIRVGTASWSDPGFAQYWYPKGLPAIDRLPWYAQHFDLVEVNSTFYALPQWRTTEHWAKVTPRGFLFDVKLYKALSRHGADASSLPKDLREKVEYKGKRAVLTPALEEELIRRFLLGIAPLKDEGKLGALLLQLSPSFGPTEHMLSELDTLFDALAGYRVAVELRNRRWVEPQHFNETAEYFRSRHLAFVLVGSPMGEHFMIMPPLNLVTAPDVRYLRAHGRNLEGYLYGKSVAERFNHEYSEEELREIARRVETVAQEARETHVIFNNNAKDFAPRAALMFKKILEKSQGLGLSPRRPGVLEPVKVRVSSPPKKEIPASWRFGS